MDSLDKKFYRIADVAEMLRLPMSTLRFWEKEFGCLRPQRTPSGQRLYTPADIERLRIIRFLIKDKGMTLDGARQHLSSVRANTDKVHAAISRLQSMRRNVNAIIEALDARQRQLRKKEL